MELKVELSEDGLQDAIKVLEMYKIKLRESVRHFVLKLSEAGYKVIKARLGRAGSGASSSAVTVIDINHSSKNIYKATISLSGSEVLFIEFGAGVYYNGSLGSSPNPLGIETGYVIGSYPGQTHAGDDYWFYTDEDGQKHYTHGTKAQMPMYNASEYMRGHIGSIAREIFKT